MIWWKMEGLPTLRRSLLCNGSSCIIMSYADMKNKIFPNGFQQRFALIVLLGLLSVTLTGCQIFASKVARQYLDGIPSNAHLAMLPFINHTAVPG